MRPHCVAPSRQELSFTAPRHHNAADMQLRLSRRAAFPVRGRYGALSCGILVARARPALASVGKAHARPVGTGPDQGRGRRCRAALLPRPTLQPAAAASPANLTLAHWLLRNSYLAGEGGGEREVCPKACLFWPKAPAWPARGTPSACSRLRGSCSCPSSPSSAPRVQPRRGHCQQLLLSRGGEAVAAARAAVSRRRDSSAPRLPRSRETAARQPHCQQLAWWALPGRAAATSPSAPRAGARARTGRTWKLSTCDKI
jgi:hypothetical protein